MRYSAGIAAAAACLMAAPASAVTFTGTTERGDNYYRLGGAISGNYFQIDFDSSAPVDFDIDLQGYVIYCVYDTSIPDSPFANYCNDTFASAYTDFDDTTSETFMLKYEGFGSRVYISRPRYVTYSISTSVFAYLFDPVGGSTFSIGIESFYGGIPEPTTWAMLIGGIGLVGAALRRSKPKVCYV